MKTTLDKTYNYHTKPTANNNNQQTPTMSFSVSATSRTTLTCSKSLDEVQSLLKAFVNEKLPLRKTCMIASAEPGDLSVSYDQLSLFKNQRSCDPQELPVKFEGEWVLFAHMILSKFFWDITHSFEFTFREGGSLQITFEPLYPEEPSPGLKVTVTLHPPMM